ncbi:MAG: hypothetical protein ACJ76I_11830 [Gaiellaceae bacterium]
MTSLLRALSHALSPLDEELRLHFPAPTSHDLLRDALGGDTLRFKDGAGDGDDNEGDDDGDDDEEEGDDDDESGDDAETGKKKSKSQAGDDKKKPQAGDDGETLSLEAARKLRRENKRLRDRAKAAETKATELEGKDLSDAEKAQRERDTEKERAGTLEQQNRALRVKAAAMEAGVPAKRVKAAAALIDWDDVDADDDDAIADALKGLRKEHDYLFETDTSGKKKPGDIDAGKRGKGKPSDADVSPGMGRLRAAYSKND